MSQIKLIITDFDGTLVDTFKANFMAYHQAFAEVGLILDEAIYRQCFGFRFEKFMQAVNVNDIETAQSIRRLKSDYYPQYFEYFKPNASLIEFIRMVRRNGCQTSVASTARRKNLDNALRHIGVYDDFDVILAGEDVINGKPNPEIYNTIMNQLGVQPNETLIFEDSQVGIEAAEACGANYMRIWNLM